MTDDNKQNASRMSKLFDIRLVVGGLLALYGAILVVAGLVDSHPKKSGGMHLNLWTGLAMLVVGLAMLAWMRLRPLAPPDVSDAGEDEGPHESRAA